jgi:hypothetical protein
MIRIRTSKVLAVPELTIVLKFAVARLNLHKENRMPNSKSRAVLLPIALLTLSLNFACSSAPVLRPAPDASLVDDKTLTATDSAEGVRLTARYDAWKGDVNINQAVTPLRISIENESGRKVRIRYSDFSLVTDQNIRLAALPPYDVKGSVSAPAMRREYAPLTRPGFRHNGFRIAPHYYAIYPFLTPYALQGLYFDPYYYSFYYPYWDRMRIELPTADMLRNVVPEGVLDEGGELEGFLYFEKLQNTDADARVNFHVDLQDAITGQTFATLHIPFVFRVPGFSG